MIFDILSWLASLIINVISTTGYFGVTFLMALESACLPIPSEIVMPFSGYLVTVGRFNFWAVVFGGTMGNLIGSLAIYYVGLWGGRPFVNKYKRYILIGENDLLRAEKWFEKYGSPAIFFSRLMPVVRTFISLPAGVARMDVTKFIAYTFFGSLPWNFGLTYLGLVLGENWESLEMYFKRLDLLILMLVVLGAAWWLKQHLKKSKKQML